MNKCDNCPYKKRYDERKKLEDGIAYIVAFMLACGAPWMAATLLNNGDIAGAVFWVVMGVAGLFTILMRLAEWIGVIDNGNGR